MKEPVLMKCGCVAHAVLTATKGVPHEPKPACVIHECYEVADSKPDLTGRMSKCCANSIVPSSYDLAFFEFKGDGSRHATQMCKCGYYESAHRPEFQHKCKTFRPAGPAQYDKHYCGCMGWD